MIFWLVMFAIFTWNWLFASSLTKLLGTCMKASDPLFRLIPSRCNAFLSGAPRATAVRVAIASGSIVSCRRALAFHCVRFPSAGFFTSVLQGEDSNEFGLQLAVKISVGVGPGIAGMQ